MELAQEVIHHCPGEKQKPGDCCVYDTPEGLYILKKSENWDSKENGVHVLLCKKSDEQGKFHIKMIREAFKVNDIMFELDDYEVNNALTWAKTFWVIEEEPPEMTKFLLCDVGTDIMSQVWDVL